MPFYLCLSNKWVEVGKTEVIWDTLNPKFIRHFQVEYRFEEKQKFKCKIFDVDDPSETASLDKHDFIGEIEFFLHEVVTAKNQQLKKPLQNNQNKRSNNGIIMITGDEQAEQTNNELMDFEMICSVKETPGFYEKFFFII